MSWRSMFIEDDSAWPGVGFNPAKGDLHAIQALASDVKSVGDELDELDQLLKSVGKSDGAWEGEAAQNFAKKLGELPKYLKQGSESMHDCAKALRGWHTHLQTFQDKAGKIEAEAAPARKQADADREHFNELYRKYQPYFGQPMEAAEAKKIDDTMDAARDKANTSKDKLEDLIREAERIHAQWKDRAGEAERAILKASENHPPDIHWWNRAVDGLKSAWRGFKDWLVEHADLLSTISAALAAAALACQIIPGVGTAAGALLGGASAVFAAGAMAGHWMGNARGNGTPGWKIGLDALGIIPGVGGVAKGAISAFKVGAKGAKTAGLIGKAGAGIKGLGSIGKVGKVGEEVEEGLRNPLSMKAINWGLSKVPGEAKLSLPQAPTQLIIKGGSAINGAVHQFTGHNDDRPKASSAPSGSAFHQTLAA
ncbi:WXG100 family type VII secretion target [Streptomyces chrestomyceticus]|uniref:WXG100 family type VII secretion target n=1 Tax=Streptomyces chrestomyceticus TaxID=68185 RepID=UPI0004CB5A25